MADMVERDDNNWTEEKEHKYMQQLIGLPVTDVSYSDVDGWMFEFDHRFRVVITTEGETTLATWMEQSVN